MNLKDFFAHKENAPELYWSLILEPGWAQAAVWYIDTEGVAQVVAHSTPSPWEEEDEMVGASDAALSSCIQKLPEDFPEPTKTVFGVPHSWVKEGEIREEFLDKIKTVCGELSLTPTGFVVLSEAFAHILKSDEGSAANAIFLGLAKENIEISVFKLGNLVGTSEVARSVSLVDDVVEGLSRFSGSSPLPSRIIVFDGRESEVNEAQDSLNSVSWDDKEEVKFLHTPKVETLSNERKVLAVSLAGASEIANVTKIEEKKDESLPVSDEETLKEQSNLGDQEELPNADELGFIVGKDVGEAPVAKSEVDIPEKGEEDKIPPMGDNIQPSPQEKMGMGAKFNPSPYIEKTKSLFHSLYGKVKTKGDGQQMGMKRFIPFILASVMILVSVILLWWFVPKATVSIYVSPKKFERNMEIGFPIDSVQTTEVTGEKTKNATGTKVIGEKATGTVEIRNGTGSVINLAAGTVLISSGDLKFTLDKSASVSAALSPSNPGTSSVPVTADGIGAEYNLAKDEIFKVGNYPKAEVDATVTSDLTGGSSREISAISEDDVDNLKESLLNELLGKAKEELTLSLPADKILVDDFVAQEITDETFNHKTGDEADNLKLSMTMNIKAVVTERSFLGDKIREELKDDLPDGFVLRDSQITYEFKFSEETDSEYVFDVNVGANFLPEIKNDEIIKQIEGRSPTVVEEFLKSVPGYSHAEIKIRPHFPGIFGGLPRVGKNITIEIVAEK